MAFTWKRSSAPRAAAGYPDTNKAVAKRLRAEGDGLRRTGPVLLRNGTNSFFVSAGSYAYLSVEADDQGVHSIVGRSTINGQPTVLASFGSRQAALNANEALLRAHAGLGAGSSKLTIFKWFGAVTALYLMATVVGASAGAASSQLAGARPAMIASSTHEAPASAAPSPQGFDRNEPSLEQLAAGEYRFDPKLKAPQVELPTLECAQPGAKQK